MTFRRNFRYSVATVASLVVFVLLLFGSGPCAAARVSNDDLQKEYGDKVLTLRHFYSGDRLHFDATGRRPMASESGAWTLYGQVRVESISLDGSVIRIHAQRMLLFFDPETKQLRDMHSTPKGDATSKLFDRKKVDKLAKRKTEIEVACGVPQPEMADAIKAMNSVFLAPDEPLSGVVPDFWKRWLEPKSAPKKELGIVEPTANGALADGASGAMQQNVSTPRHQETPLPENHAGTFRVGGGVKAPRVIYAPDPAYSEIARQARYEATSVLWLVVDADGLPRNITIVRPSGLGLDEEAVRAVSSWKFDPATKEGRPVSVQINVEVSFRLY